MVIYGCFVIRFWFLYYFCAIKSLNNSEEWNKEVQRFPWSNLSLNLYKSRDCAFLLQIYFLRTGGVSFKLRQPGKQTQRYKDELLVLSKKHKISPLQTKNKLFLSIFSSLYINYLLSQPKIYLIWMSNTTFWYYWLQIVSQTLL